MSAVLDIKDLHISVQDKEVVHGVSLRVAQGRVVALMGPNGSGKSSFVNAIMGHPRYIVTSGRIFLNDEDITDIPPNEKAKKGIFLSLQNPPSLPGITVSSFLRNAVAATMGESIPVLAFRAYLEEEMKKLGMDTNMAGRHVNEGFSGGEKKRLEALQLALLRPIFALLDETDAGLDVDALRIITETIQRMSSDMGILFITHHTQILEYLVPDEVHIMQDGQITRSGGKELAEQIEKQGYGI